MKRNLLAVMGMLLVLPLFAQGTFVQSETECLGVEMDGSQTLRSWAFGKNKKDAVEQVKKQAVYDVIFKGIRSNGMGCDMRPLVPEANARERHEDYFNKFFRDNGDYLNYVSMKDTKIGSKTKSKSKIGVKYGIVVRIDRAQLKARLKKDNIIPNE